MPCPYGGEPSEEEKGGPAKEDDDDEGEPLPRPVPVGPPVPPFPPLYGKRGGKSVEDTILDYLAENEYDATVEADEILRRIGGRPPEVEIPERRVLQPHGGKPERPEKAQELVERLQELGVRTAEDQIHKGQRMHPPRKYPAPTSLPKADVMYSWVEEKLSQYIEGWPRRSAGKTAASERKAFTRGGGLDRGSGKSKGKGGPIGAGGKVFNFVSRIRGYFK